jgi:hypothetical protein
MKINDTPSIKIVRLLGYFNLGLGIFILITTLFFKGCIGNYLIINLSKIL